MMKDEKEDIDFEDNVRDFGGDVCYDTIPLSSQSIALAADHEQQEDKTQSLAIALATTTANERDKKQRKILTEHLVRVLYDTLDCPSAAENPNDPSTATSVITCAEVIPVIVVDAQAVALAVDGVEVQSISSPQDYSPTKTDENQSSDLVHERAELVERILGATNAEAVVSPTTEILLNRGQPLSLEWDWQESRDGDGVIEYSTCTLRALADDGAVIQFYAPPMTTSSTEAERKELDHQESEKIAICKVSKFQWRLEGSTKKPGDLEEIQSCWNVENATFSLNSKPGSLNGVVAEKILLKGTEISLTGRISKKFEGRRHPLQLQSKSVLSLEVSSVESLGGNDESFISVGLALRELVAYLDNIAYVPNLHLSLTHHNGESDKVAKGNTFPSFEESGGTSNSLGDAMKYYLNYYCNGTNNTNITDAAATLGQPSKFLSIGDSVTTFGAMTVIGTSCVTPIGAAVSMAALVAKDGVGEAARIGKEARLLTAAATGTESEDRYRFGDVTRGVIGSIRGNHQQQQHQKQQQQQQQQRASQPSDGDCSANYLEQNKGRFTGVAVGTAGAAAGLVIAGPLGAMAGSFLGSMGSQAVLESQANKARTLADKDTIKQNGNGNEGFRLRDRARALVTKGKEATGRNTAEGYRFGDVSRGLFASTRGKGTTTPCS
jgi:hypothetical protein